MNSLAVRLPQYAVEQTVKHAGRILTYVRLTSPVLTTACTNAGLPLPLAEMCGGLLASLVDDVVAVSKLPRNDFERTKRMERILKAAEEPQASALKLAMACSPVNGRAAVSHWDIICEQQDKGRLAWLLGMDTENGWRYGRKLEKRNNGPDQA